MVTAYPLRGRRPSAVDSRQRMASDLLMEQKPFIKGVEHRTFPSCHAIAVLAVAKQEQVFVDILLLDFKYRLPALHGEECEMIQFAPDDHCMPPRFADSYQVSAIIKDRLTSFVESPRTFLVVHA